MKPFRFTNQYNDARVLIKDLKKKPAAYWQSRGQKMALRLFYAMAARVPAYKDFLKRNRINPTSIKTIADFSLLPAVDKENYLRKYQRKDLCWDGKFAETNWVISTTSGSTGEPFYFPRTREQDRQYALTAELYLRTNFQIHKKSTLYIVGFPMGAWIGGVFTYEALRQIADSGKYKLSIITPGINKAEILKAVKNLGPSFDQIIIGSYGPFLKDILDDGLNQGLNWKRYDLGFVFSAEGFSESFRDYVLSIAGIKNPYRSTLNHYGTVDLGTMSYETPESILIRRAAVENPAVYKSIFHDTIQLPTLTQFMPEMFYFESTNGNLICSANSGLPLIRYDLKDHGGVISYGDMHERLAQAGIVIQSQAQKVGITDTLWRLPFVHVFERSDFSVSFFAFQIYPATIRKAVQEKIFHKDITGKFSMQVLFDNKSNQYLEINVELKSGKKEYAKLRKLLTDRLVNHLTHDSSEYRRTREEYKQQTTPKIVFWPYEHELYFKPGIKQKWVKK